MLTAGFDKPKKRSLYWTDFGDTFRGAILMTGCLSPSMKLTFPFFQTQFTSEFCRLSFYPTMVMMVNWVSAFCLRSFTFPVELND